MTQNNVKPVVSKSKWISSVREFRSTRVVVFCGMMCALAIVLNYTSTIRIGDYIRIGFSGIPNRVVDYLFGPFVGAVWPGSSRPSCWSRYCLTAASIPSGCRCCTDRALWPSCRAGSFPTRSCCRWIPCSTTLSCRRWTDISVPVSWRTEYL